LRLHVLTAGTRNIDDAEPEERQAKEAATAAIFAEFLARRLGADVARRVG